MKKLNRNLLKHISGGQRISYAICLDGYCPPPPVPGKKSYCVGRNCYYELLPGNGNGGGGGTCNEPTRICAEGETGCGCVYS